MKGAPIVRVWWQSFRLPMRRSMVASHGTMEHRDGLVVGIEDAAGRTAYGEASPLTSYAGGTVEEAAAIVAHLGGRLLGRTADAAFDLPSDCPGTPGAIAAARCGLETAAGSLAAAVAGEGLGSWLAARAGLAQHDAPIPVNAIVDAVEPGDAAQQAIELAARGFRVLKLKVGRDHEADFARVAAVCGIGGWGVRARLDPNGAWPAEEALTLLRRYESLGVTLCEQPISHNDRDALAAMAGFRGATSIVIAADESCRSLGDLDALLAAGAADVVVIKPMVTGLWEAVRMVKRANATLTPAIVTTTFDSGIGTAAAIHIASLVAPAVLACGLTTAEQLAADLVTGLPAAAGGHLARPSGPGLGVTLDPRSLATYGTSTTGEVRL